MIRLIIAVYKTRRKPKENFPGHPTIGKIKSSSKPSPDRGHLNLLLGVPEHCLLYTSDAADDPRVV